MMIGYKITATGSKASVTVFDSEAVYDYVMKIVDDEQELEAIEASSWSEIASLGQIFEQEDFTVEIVDTEE